MTRPIDSIRRAVPAGLEEVAQLGPTLWRRRADILAFFDHHASNGPTEATNERLEALRRNALGTPKPHPLPNPLAPAQRRTPTIRQRTLNYEEPLIDSGLHAGLVLEMFMQTHAKGWGFCAGGWIRLGREAESA
jgi:Transposase